MLLGYPHGEVNRHLGVDHAPVLPPTDSLFGNIHHGQIQHFQQAVVGGEYRFGLGYLAQLAVEAFNVIGSIDQPSDLLGILEVGAQIGLVVPPGLGDFGVFLVPVLPKDVQGIQSGLFVYGGIDCLQISHQGLKVLVGHILAGITQLVNDTVLYFSLREHCMDRRIKSSEVVGTGNKKYPLHRDFSDYSAQLPRTWRSDFHRPTSPEHLSCRPGLRQWQCKRPSSQSGLRCGHGSGWHPERPQHTALPKAAAATLWRWEVSYP